MDVPVVSVRDLHTRLGFGNPLDYPESSLRKPLSNWDMETDDAPIFRYIYRHFRPMRHLEFGTWQGTGVLFCLEECDATVWTINLPQGEELPGGGWAYSSGFKVGEETSLASRLLFWVRRKERELPSCAKKQELSKGYSCYQTDSMGFIGRHYIEAGMGHRVCQIYSDSRDWDVENYPEGFFDTALVDGGHMEDVVTNDTRKACNLVRSGGLIMWHDFCPLGEVQERCLSTQGVVNAIQGNWEWLGEQMKDIFWIEPSWILLGVRR